MSETKKSLSDFYETKAKDIMQTATQEFPCVDENADVTAVLESLSKKDHIWVLSSEEPTKLVGVITESDIVALLSPPVTSLQTFEKPDLRSLQYGLRMVAGEIMSKKPITASMNEKIRDILITMKEQRIKQIPIVDTNNRLLGEISLRHIVQEYSMHFASDLVI